MNDVAVRLGLGLACACLMSSAALSGEAMTSELKLTAASSTCPSGLLGPGQAIAVEFSLPEVTKGNGSMSPSVTLSGEIRDYAVRGCTVSFSGGSTAPLSAASLAMTDGIAQGRGCRGYCGL